MKNISLIIMLLLSFLALPAKADETQKSIEEIHNVIPIENPDEAALINKHGLEYYESDDEFEDDLDIEDELGDEFGDEDFDDEDFGDDEFDDDDFDDEEFEDEEFEDNFSEEDFEDEGI